MTTPIIGVSTGRLTDPNIQRDQVATPASYLRAVLAAGGIPLLIPPDLTHDQLAETLSRLNGLVLIGGGDLDPVLFNGKPHPRVYDIDPARDFLDLTLARLAAEQRVPFLGICRGIQVVNVALGGTLYTDIGDQFPGALRHDWYPNIPRNHLAHKVTVEAGSRLANILGGTSFQVNSLHHQGLDQPAPGLRVTAWSPDELIEAVELPDHPFGVAVQWHPEWLQEHAPQRALFAALVSAANGRSDD
jgi:putative glutamine amidotransferase